MKQCNPRCRANWIYTTRYFPAFAVPSPSCSVVISVISTHVPPFVPFSLPHASAHLAHICILYHPSSLGGQTLRSSTHEDIHKSGYPPRVAQFTDEQSRDVSTLSFFFKLFFSPSSSSTTFFSLFHNLSIFLAFFQSYTPHAFYSLRKLISFN